MDVIKEENNIIKKNLTIENLAKYINIPVDILIEKLSIAGFKKSKEDYITEEEKKIFLSIINNKSSYSHLTVKRKTHTILNISSFDGKNKSVSIEIRKKCTYLKEEKEINKSSKIIKTNRIINKEKNKLYSKTEIINFKDKDKNNNFIENNNNTIKEYNNCNDNKSFKQKYKISRFKQKNNNEEKIITNNKKRKLNLNHLEQNITKKIVQIINRDIIIGETITIAELANKMAIKSSQLIQIMMKMGAMVTINQVIDQETAQLVAEHIGHKVILKNENELEKSIINDRNKEIIEIDIEPRAPIVTIMGHVDHGKTSLLDYIRSTKVASKEAGGITQHIGAYNVKTNNGMITFLDTPGHEAFTAMRLRGVQATDIIVLIVAADDGVMPQTIEAIQHAKEANVPIIVAINKIDKLNADPERVKQELTKYGIIQESWGGDVLFVNISAKLGIGINELLEAILLQSEMLDLKTIRNRMATGVVIESFLDKGRGPVASILVKEGILKKGDIILCGLEYGRVRAILNELGKEIIKVGPSIPVKILGLSGIPQSGQEIIVVKDEKKARELALYRQGKFRDIKLAKKKKDNSKKIFAYTNTENLCELKIILKADTQGSVEAILNSLEKLSNEKIKVHIIKYGVGGITENDVILALTYQAILIGFNVRSNSSANKIIENEKLDIRFHSIIYHLIDEVNKILNNKLKPKYKEQIIGIAEVKNIFKLNKIDSIAGCIINSGIIKKTNTIRVIRNNKFIYEGELESLRRFKEDVNEIKNGMECGIKIKNFYDICLGDIFEIIEKIEIKNI